MTENQAQDALIALRRILRATDLNARQLASSTGLTPSQLIVLQLVTGAGRVLPSSIARQVHLTQATVTSLVDKLVAAGLVRRTRDTEDRRRIWIDATDAGRRLIETAPDLLQDRFRAGFDALRDWEQSMIVSILERISSMLDAGNIDAAAVLDSGDIDR